MKKTKLIGTIIGIIIFIAMIAGLTYAWYTWRSSNIVVSGNSSCFTIDYEIGQEIGTTTSPAKLALGESYTDGQAAIVSLSINEACEGIKGKGTIYLNTNSSGTTNSILTGALKYSVIKKGEEESSEVLSGSITSKNRITIASNINLESTIKDTYEVWVWIDGNIADNTYYKATYSGYISAEVTQVE